MDWKDFGLVLPLMRKPEAQPEVALILQRERRLLQEMMMGLHREHQALRLEKEMAQPLPSGTPRTRTKQCAQPCRLKRLQIRTH